MDVYLHPYLSSATVKLLHPLYDKCKALRNPDSDRRFRVDFCDLTIKVKSKGKDTEESMFILTNESEIVPLGKVTYDVM